MVETKRNLDQPAQIRAEQPGPGRDQRSQPIYIEGSHGRRGVEHSQRPQVHV